MKTLAAPAQPPKVNASNRRVDPILQEVYDLKAQLNKEAGYSVIKILERVKQSTKSVVPQ